VSAQRGWRGYRVLDALAVVGGLLTVLLLVLPASVTVAPDRPRLPAAPNAAIGEGREEIMRQRATADAGQVEALRRAMVQTNLFSASRREPTERFVAPGAEPTPSTLPVDAGPAGLESPTPDTELQLFGIVSGDGGPKALIQLPVAGAPPRLLGVGESMGGVRVLRIAGDRVVISTSSGTRTLRLSRVVPDSSENQP
jgi:hypothetical protein